jgi:hypothetical protein
MKRKFLMEVKKGMNNKEVEIVLTVFNDEIAEWIDKVDSDKTPFVKLGKKGSTLIALCSTKETS